jgi:transposase
MGEKRFHGDETRWEGFEDVAGKTGQRWYLWGMQSASVVFYRMAPGRGADVPQGHCAKLHKDLVAVGLVGDRYSAYKCLAKPCDELILAFCWAHVRRDFLKAARSWPDLERWMCIWVDDIRELDRLHAARLEAWDETLPRDLQPLDFTERHQALETKLSTMQACCETHLQEPTLPLAQHKVLSRLHNHWAGLTSFVGPPEVAMDNTTAERTLRTPVVGRKNSYGSGSVWRAHLAARMFSVLQTVVLWGRNPHHWLSAFLPACADHGSPCPPDLRACLPWQMTPERREELTRPAPGTLSPLTDQTPEGDKTAVVDTSEDQLCQVSCPTSNPVPAGSPGRPPSRTSVVCACPIGAERVSRVTRSSCPINAGAVMTWCSATDFLPWVRRILTGEVSQLLDM